MVKVYLNTLMEFGLKSVIIISLLIGKNMKEVTIIRYESKYKDQLIEFLSLFNNPSFDYEHKKKQFEWENEKNPYIKNPLIYLALDGEKIVGHRSFVVQKFKLKSDVYFFGIPTAGTVHPDYRRLGIFKNILDFSREDLIYNSDLKLILSLSPNKIATASLLKTGYFPIGKRKKMYLLSSLKAIKNKLSNNLYSHGSIFTNKNGIKIEITTELRLKEISSFMTKCNDYNKISNVRDAQFYNWRFNKSPYDHIYMYCTNNDELVGFISLEKNILHFNSLIELNFYHMMEYGYIQNDYFEFLIETLKKRLSLPVVMAYNFTRRKIEISILEKYGFLGSDKLVIRALNMIMPDKRIIEDNLPGALIKPISREIKENDFILNGMDIRLEENWSLFRSDVH